MSNTKTIISSVLFVLVLTASLFADSIEISGMQIPIIEGARLTRSGTDRADKAEIVTYIVKKRLDEVVSFYRVFFEENGFVLIGVEKRDSFDVSVKLTGINPVSKNTTREYVAVLGINAASAEDGTVLFLEHFRNIYRRIINK